MCVAYRDVSSSDPKYGRASEWRRQRWVRYRYTAENEGGNHLSQSPSPQVHEPFLCETERMKKNSDDQATDLHESLSGKLPVPTPSVCTCRLPPDHARCYICEGLPTMPSWLVLLPGWPELPRGLV